MGGEGAFRIGGGNARIAPFGVQDPALRIILQIGDHDLIQHLIMDGGVEDGGHHFDPPIQVPGHPVG